MNSVKHRLIGLLSAVLKSDELYFLNIFSANKIVVLYSVDLYVLYYSVAARSEAQVCGRADFFLSLVSVCVVR
jgi:hypothetical protein